MKKLKTPKIHVAKVAKAKTIKVKAFKPSKMARAKPYHVSPPSKTVKPAYTPTQTEEPTTIKGALNQIKAEMPPMPGGGDNTPSIRGRMAASAGRSGHKKTAKTQEQLDKEVKAYGPSKK
jgi:hypothetical protein